MNKRQFLYLLIALLPVLSARAQSSGKSGQQRVHTLSNEQMALQIDLFGGAYTNLALRKPESVNPLTWKLTRKEMPPNNQNGAPFQGHFLCLGRWGSPTQGEIEKGVPHNGQATNTMWKRGEASDKRTLHMSNSTPLDGMHIERKVHLNEKKPVFHVTEKITNTTSIARLNNVVQHVTLGPPFLNAQTVINANAREGFLQEFAYPDPAKYAFCFPFARIDEKGIDLDLRKTQPAQNYVSTHLMGDSIGWVTALQPEKNLVIGYIWKTAAYPWINIWNQTENQKPVAKGIEFGTTGIGRPYNQLLRVPARFHGHESYEFLDAGQTVVKKFTGFISRVPENVKAIKKVERKNGRIFIYTQNGKTLEPKSQVP